MHRLDDVNFSSPNSSKTPNHSQSTKHPQSTAASASAKPPQLIKRPQPWERLDPRYAKLVKDIHPSLMMNSKTVKPMNEAILKNGVQTIDQLIRIDKHTFEDIEKVVEWAACDLFWSRNMLSVAALRAYSKSSKDRSKFDNIYASWEQDQKVVEPPVTDIPEGVVEAALDGKVLNYRREYVVLYKHLQDYIDWYQDNVGFRENTWDWGTDFQLNYMGVVHFLKRYRFWVDNECSWVTNITPALFSPNSKVFIQFLKEVTEMTGDDPRAFAWMKKKHHDEQKRKQRDSEMAA